MEIHPLDSDRNIYIYIYKINLYRIKESHKIYKSWSNITHHAHNDDSNTTTIMVIVLSIIGGLMVIGLIICLVIRCKKRRENQETGGEYAVI